MHSVVQVLGNQGICVAMKVFVSLMGCRGNRGIDHRSDATAVLFNGKLERLNTG